MISSGEDFMKSAVLVEPQKIKIQETPNPEPKAGEVVVQPTLAGVCGSDYSLYKGKFKVPLPVIPGHEAVGKVVRAGQVASNLTPGLRVAIQPNFPCRICPVCRAGHENVCTAKIRLGIDIPGVFAQEVSVPADYVWPLPDELDDEVAVFVEPLAVAMHGINLAKPEPGQKVLIIGSGVIGSLALQLAVNCGAEVTACDIEGARLEMAKKLGATEVFNAYSRDAFAVNKFDLVVEASGSPSALSQAVELAAPGGNVILIGLPGQEHSLLSDLIVRKGLKIYGSMIYINEFPEAINALKAGRIQTQPLISHRLKLENLEQKIIDFYTPDRIKMIVVV